MGGAAGWPQAPLGCTLADNKLPTPSRSRAFPNALLPETEISEDPRSTRTPPDPRPRSGEARLRLHRLYEALSERTAALLGRSDPLLPPTSLMFVGGSRRDFRKLGEKWLATFVRIGGLKPSDNVLDVGCGVGRMAVALGGYLDPGAKYRGFDIVPEGIAWCRKAITPRYPQFEFQHADIYHEEYNRSGVLRASEFVFPYPDEAFEFVFLTSVFTHMLPADVKHYMAEIRRVLRPRRALFDHLVHPGFHRQRANRVRANQPAPPFHSRPGGLLGGRGPDARGCSGLR